MARLARLSVAGLPHHLIQRGNDRQLIFRDTADHAFFIECLQAVAGERGLAIHAYVLMPNHLHLLATPPEADTLGRVMQAVGRRYVRWFNDRYARSGTLWEGRYRSTVIEADRYLLACSRYIELNPVRAGLAADPVAYHWSSHAHHVGRRIDPLISDHPLYWALGNTPFERQARYRAVFDGPSDTEFLDRLRHGTNRGWAIGEGEFLARLQAAPTRPLTPRPRGRPFKATKSTD